ncbi:nucleotidyltransferase family protein [Methylobacillus flagellatus]|uniref:nucleotidyltransferase family protein n=1 Tax=Methylobacillus flagellatus TaxID=405 RepID=UPI0010F4643F|nr:nucleotidyltransferase family protein [Methylobacillus flagellatus]
MPASLTHALPESGLVPVPAPVGILLAAGFSRRFGEADKLLQSLPDGQVLAVAAARNLLAALPLSYAIVRPDNTRLAELLRGAGMQVLCCEPAAQGMADSLASAVRQIMAMAAPASFVIALADMPCIQPASIAAVGDALQAGASVVVPQHDDAVYASIEASVDAGRAQRGHPVGFSVRYAAELMALHGDVGARSLLKRHADEVRVITVNDAGILQDVDTPAALLALRPVQP